MKMLSIFKFKWRLAIAGMLCLSAQARAAIPLAEARAKIDTAVSDAKAMTALMKQLSAEDQVSFLGDVNAAVSKMPGAKEERAAAFLNVNSAALRTAAKGNTATLLAEVYATVSPEALTVLNKHFADNLFNRAANPVRAYSDGEFTYIATNMMAKIVKRTSGSDEAAVRNALAALMFVRASNAAPSNLADLLLAQMPDDAARELAKNEWFPAALGEHPDYDSMLAYANAASQPDAQVVLRLAGPQIMDAMLADLSTGAIDPAGRTSTPLLDRKVGNFGDAILNHPDPEKHISFGEEPRPYQWQRY